MGGYVDERQRQGDRGTLRCAPLSAVSAFTAQQCAVGFSSIQIIDLETQGKA